MKRIFLALTFASCLGAAFFTGCKKDEALGCNDGNRNITVPASEKTDIINFMASRGLTGYTQDSSGVFYKIETPSTTSIPGLCSVVNVAYVGSLTNGSIFDQSTAASFTLGGTIEGWRKGIPKVGKGGKVKLIIPPSLGYGNQEVRNSQAIVIIPNNSILLFDVTVNNVQ